MALRPERNTVNVNTPTISEYRVALPQASRFGRLFHHPIVG